MNCKDCNKLSCMDCVGELEKQLAVAHKALEATCKRLSELEDCRPICGDWHEYYLQQAAAELKGDEGNE